MISKKLHKLLMTSARLIYGSYGYKISCSKILEVAQLLTVRRMLRTTAVNLVNSVLYYRKPHSLYTLLKIPNRFTAPIIPKHLPRTSKFRNFYFYKMINYYNELPLKFKNISIKKFRGLLKGDAMKGLVVSAV